MRRKRKRKERGSKKWEVAKPEREGGGAGVIDTEGRGFEEDRTRLFTGLQKCQSAEAYEVFEDAVEALNKINAMFAEKREQQREEIRKNSKVSS